MINTSAMNNRLVMDPDATRSLSELARKDPQAAVKQVAGQFEALMMGQLMSSMRASSLDDEEDSQEMDTYRNMYDQQVVQTMVQAGGFGLAEALSKYLLKSMPDEMPPLPQQGLAAAPRELPVTTAAQSGRCLHCAVAAGKYCHRKRQGCAAWRQAGLYRRHAAACRQAAARLGVAPEVLVGHAALESGWGQRAIRHPDGRNSYNLFGIKASQGWRGEVVATLTTEYEGGVAQKQVDSFRSYPSLQAAFDDYARLLADNPRYQQALNQGQNAAAFASALQRGGYATDPAYAQKLQAVIRTVANA